VKYWLCFFFFSVFALEAGSVRLFNNSAYKLRVVIRSGDNSYLGELLINPQQTMTWNDYNGVVNYPNQSQTPYTIVWFCNDEENTPYAVCTNVGTGYTVAAHSCDGTRACKPPKEKEYPPTEGEPTEEYLQKKTQRAAGPPEGQMP